MTSMAEGAVYGRLVAVMSRYLSDASVEAQIAGIKMANQVD